MSGPPAQPTSPSWWAPSAALALAAVLVAAAGDGARVALRWERAALADEPWRLVTGNLAHLGVRHLLLNLAALASIAALARVERARALAGARGALVIGVAMLGTGLGLRAFEPALDWYVGLSGALHGMLAAVAVERAADRGRRAWWGIAVLALLGSKLAWELGAGPSPTTAALAGGPVVVAAHLHGAVAGVVVAVALALGDRRRAPTTAQV